MSISIEEKLKQINTMNIASISDAGTLQELASIAEELINSSNPAHRFAASKINSRLQENAHYKELLKANLIQKEEVKATADKQFERAYQVHRETASTANLQSRKQEEAKESKATQEAFNKLTTQQQQAIIKLEYLYLPELRQQVREFMLDDSKATAENLANIMNKQLGGDYVQVEIGKDGSKFTTMADNTPTDKTNEIEHIAQEGFNTSIELGKVPQAVEYGKVVNAANVKEADNNFTEGKDKAYHIWQVKTPEGKIATDIQGIAFQLNENVFKKYAENLQKLENVPENLKEKLRANYENDLADNIENFLTKHNVDLSNDEQKELFVKSVLENNHTTLSEQQLKNILVKNCGIESDFIENFIEEKKKLDKENAAIADEIDTPAPAKEITLQKPLIKEYDQKSERTWDETITEKNEKTYNEELYPKAVKTEEEIKAAELTHTNQNQNKETATVAIIDINNK